MGIGPAVSQVDLAKQLGVERGAVGRWERLEREPDLLTILRIADVCGVNPGWLAFDSGPMPALPRTDTDVEEATEPIQKPGRGNGKRSA